MFLDLALCLLLYLLSSLVCSFLTAAILTYSPVICDLLLFLFIFSSPEAALHRFLSGLKPLGDASFLLVFSDSAPGITVMLSLLFPVFPPVSGGPVALGLCFSATNWEDMWFTRFITCSLRRRCEFPELVPPIKDCEFPELVPPIDSKENLLYWR